MAQIADLFKAQLDALKAADAESARKTAETIARAHALISDLEEQERRWQIEDNEI